MMPLILANAQVVHGDPTVAPRLTDILLRDGRIAAVGEPFRAGRWWWEDEGAKECGLHVHQDGAAEQDPELSPLGAG